MMVSGRSRVRRGTLAAMAIAALAVTTACSGGAAEPGGSDDDVEPVSSVQSQEAEQPEVEFETNVGRRDVAVDSRVTVTAHHGTIEDVTLAYGKGRAKRVTGSLSGDGSTWTADGLLEPGETYRLVTEAVDGSGETATDETRFHTQDLSLDQQTYPSLAPLDGATVGVGMPVILTFDIPVTDRAAAEKHLQVSSTPEVKGTWHWLSDTEVHFRPRSYWPAGADVTVSADLNGVDVGGGIYGQESRNISFTVGRKVVSKIDLAAHTMKVFIDGELARTIPITGGKPGFDTRSGIKVIMEKFESKRMDAATTGIDPGNPEYYNLSNVQYAMRETYSGEFIHAAPWSVGSQGYANVSHGCIGMSTDNAAWLFEQSTVGDVVEVTGSDRVMEAGNGWTDWNLSWREYKQGSAL
jgi:lipoprotein-anchoring transpeptidase ErfK/SrfK